MKEIRKLAAIMFTDIKGYTALMSRDESSAMQLLQINLAIQQRLAQKYNGELLKEMGDGTLLCFQSALDAVKCGLEIQQSSVEHKGLNLRIGIHLGDILYKGGDVFGDGVNVASRIEPLSEVGGICISGQIFQMIRNQKDIVADFIGEKTLKNVEYPVNIYAIRPKGTTPDKQDLISSEQMTEERKSIAVLPFENMSADKEQDYFCDGIAEDILNDLTCLESLYVVSRTSSFAFKGKHQDIREIGRILGAQTIVEGSVRKSGNRLRITAQLINVSDGYHIWSERYDRDFEDVFAIQDEISKNIVQALEAKLSNKEKRVLEKVKTLDVKAYDFYIKGRSYYYLLEIELATQMFQKAIGKDENYALAFSGLADSYSYFYQWYESTEELLVQALKASQRALELDPDLAEAHISRGIALTNSMEYPEAGEAFKTAIQLNPRLFEAYYQFGRSCKRQGKNNQAAKYFSTASQLRPEDYNTAIFVASAYQDSGMEEDAQKAFERAAIIFENYLDLNPGETRALYLGASALLKVGREEEALRWIEEAVSIGPDEIEVIYNAVCVYSLLGKYTEALDLFEKRVAMGHADKQWIENDSDLDSIRDHPRFIKAFKQII